MVATKKFSFIFSSLWAGGGLCSTLVAQSTRLLDARWSLKAVLNLVLFGSIRYGGMDRTILPNDVNFTG